MLDDKFQMDVSKGMRSQLLCWIKYCLNLLFQKFSFVSRLIELLNRPLVISLQYLKLALDLTLP